MVYLLFYRECPVGTDVMCVRFSPDGNHIAAGLSDGHIKVRKNTVLL